MKKDVQSGIVIVLLLWLLGGLIYLPYIEPKLNEAARKALTDPAHNGVFAAVRPAFNGQEATLTGAVATPAEKTRAEEILRNDLRIKAWLTSGINPVTSVHNRIEVNPAEAPFRPRPWLILSLFGPNQRLDGVLGHPDQRQQLLAALPTKLPTSTTPLNNQTTIAPNALDAPAWDATVNTIPSLTQPESTPKTIAVSACDGSWTVFPGDTPNATIADALKSTTVKDNEITHALAKLRAWSPDQEPPPTPTPAPAATPPLAPAPTPAPDPAETPAPAPAETRAPAPAETPAPAPAETPAETPAPAAPAPAPAAPAETPAPAPGNANPS